MVIHWVIFAPYRLQILQISRESHNGTDESPVTPQVMGCDGPLPGCDGLDGGRPI